MGRLARFLTPRVLWAIGSAVLVVALLVVVLAVRSGHGDGDQEVVSEDPDGTTTTTAGASTTTDGQDTTTTSAAAPAPTDGSSSETDAAPTSDRSAPTTPPPPRQKLMAGAEWELFRERGPDGECMVLAAGDAEQRQCGLEHLGEVPGPPLVAPLADGRRVVVMPAGAADHVEQLQHHGVLSPHALGFAHDPFVAGLRIFATDDEGTYFLRRGDAILGALYQASLITEGHFGRFPGYRRTHETVSERRFHEVGAYAPEGQTCLLVRELTYPAIRAHRCVDGRPTTFTTVLNLAYDPMLAELYAMAPLTDATEWSCELPSGASCGGGPVVEVTGLGAAVLARHEPITLDDGGTPADHITILLGDQRVEVPVDRP